MKISDRCLNKVLMLTFLIIFFLLQSLLCAFAEEPLFPSTPLDADPLQQMNRMRELMKNRQIEEQLQKDLQDHNKTVVDDEDVDKARKSKGTDLKFKIKAIQFTESTVLTKRELDKISAEYVAKEVTLDQLYQMVDKVNDLYRKKGYAVCRAFLPEQTIKDGIAKVTLVEGKTGKIKIENARFTSKSYIKARTGLVPGKVGNLAELNRRVSLFNATNDAQLSVKLAAGEAQGTTDYILTLDEVKPHNIYIFADNSGSASTGRFRYGVGWTMSNMLGIQDVLSLNFVKNDFSDSGGASYSLPITTFGTKFTASVSGNGMNMNQGSEVLNIQRPRGDSVSYSLGLNQPLYMGPSLRIVSDISWSKQYSDSWFREPFHTDGKLWMDSITNKYDVGIAFTHFGRGIVWYHRHSLTLSKYYNGIMDDNSRYLIYNLNFLRQQMFANGHSLTLRASVQLTPDDKDQLRQGEFGLSTSDYFYIGGVGSVRGYAESQIGSECGVSFNVEYAMPFRKYRNLTPIVFFDYGKVFGAYARYLNDTQLASTGLGLRWTNNDGKLSGTIWLGVPLVKQANGDKLDSCKIHFNLYAQIDSLFAPLFKEDRAVKEEENH